jgi:predicted RNA binding protein YcfA (HicA-like mRNA interferase family)
VTSIQLKAGVAFTLRRFHPFIGEPVRGGWARFVAGLSQNKATLGEAEDLTAFLFGTERASLEPYVPILLELQDGVCFYRQASLVRKTGHVDHFIPWARYPVDLAHNFVLAHDACNKDKSNVLAAYDDLERWTVRNRDHAKTLESEFDTNKLSHDLDTSRAITRWAYTIAEQSQSKVWLSRTSRFVDLDTRWRTLPGGSRGDPPVLRSRVRDWPASTAKQVLAALLKIGWTVKRTTGSHRVLARAGWSDYVFAFHDQDEIDPRMLARIGRATGLTPADL